MFTGLIESVGSILELDQRNGRHRLRVSAPAIAARLREGDSCAVSGVCLTAVDIRAESFAADLARETLARTSLGRLRRGALVNLELPTPAGRPLGGHVVQGHVDGTGQLLSLRALDALRPEISDWWLEVRVPAAVIPCLVEKGSIAVEGISLTIARHQPGSPTVGIAIIPHTFRHTNLHALEPEAPLNIEADILMKLALAERLEQRAGPAPANPPEPFELTEAFLIANGY